MRHSTEWTRSNTAGLVIVIVALGGLLVWTGAYRESVALLLLVLLVVALLGAALRALTSLFTLARLEDRSDTRAGRRRRAVSSRVD
jgi:hypothetical protein